MENTIIKIEIQITPQQLERLPLNVAHFLELAALNRLGVILSRNTETDIPQVERLKELKVEKPALHIKDNPIR